MPPSESGLCGHRNGRDWQRYRGGSRRYRAHQLTRLAKLPHLLNLSRRMMITIKCNLVFSMALNFAAIILAITGVLNPVIGALVHNAGSVLVIINSAFLLHWGRKQRSLPHS